MDFPPIAGLPQIWEASGDAGLPPVALLLRSEERKGVRKTVPADIHS